MSEKTNREIQEEELRKIIREELLADLGLMALIKDEISYIKNNGFREKDQFGRIKGKEIVERAWGEEIRKQITKTMDKNEKFLISLIREAMPSREDLVREARHYAAKSVEDIFRSQFQWR